MSARAQVSEWLRGVGTDAGRTRFVVRLEGDVYCSLVLTVCDDLLSAFVIDLNLLSFLRVFTCPMIASIFVCRSLEQEEPIELGPHRFLSLALFFTAFLSLCIAEDSLH